MIDDDDLLVPCIASTSLFERLQCKIYHDWLL